MQLKGASALQNNRHGVIGNNKDATTMVLLYDLSTWLDCTLIIGNMQHDMTCLKVHSMHHNTAWSGWNTEKRRLRLISSSV